MSPTVALASEFLDAFAALPRAQQKKVREFTEKFKADPASVAINYEKIHGAGMRESGPYLANDPVGLAGHEERERSLLFVAATRARDRLIVTGYGARSPLLGGPR